MAISVIVSWKTELRQSGWSVGYCTQCACFEAIRLGDAVQVFSVYEFFPVSQQVLGKATCCDWCQNEAGPAPEARVIPLDAWSPAQGMKSLFEKCAPALQARIPQRTSDSELHAMLTWITQQTSINAIDIGIGLLGGFLVGAGLGFMVGFAIASGEEYDPVRAPFIWCATGGAIGSILGSAIEAVLKGRKAARRMMEAAYHKYRLNGDRLTELARSYPGRIRSALRFALTQGRTG